MATGSNFMAGARIKKDLTTDEVEYYFSLLGENVTRYDCGKLCAPYNEGVPHCCVADNAVPLLFKAELEYAQQKGSDLWFAWKPKTEEDRELKSTARKDQMFCECKGARFCERDFRSISCRTFPLEPYVDRRGAFVALTFLYDFTLNHEQSGEPRCPLVERAQDIRQKFIDASFQFWEKLMLRIPDEYEIYVESSRDLRKKRAKEDYRIQLFFPTHMKKIPSSREFLW